MILTLLLAVAVLSAMAGAVTRDRTAIALLASYIVSETLCRLGAPFNIAVLLLIDVAVLTLIVRRGMPWRDVAIALLFLPAWTIYAEQPAWTRDAVTAIVAVQMLLVFPPSIARAALSKLDHFFRHYDPWDDFLKATA